MVSAITLIKPYSLKARLTVLTVLTVGAVSLAMLLAGLLQDQLTATQLTDEYDQALRAKARALDTLSNPTDCLSDVDLPYLFDRLWRADDARSGGQHVGLGLTLVRAYAEQLSLDVDVDVALSDEQVFTIRLGGRIGV